MDPISGLRVIEFGQIAAGPFTGMLLADLGADVVKVENPNTGDTMRQWPPLTENDKEEIYSENFASLNRNKRSITVDFKDEYQVNKLKTLCEDTDIIIENFRPGVLKKFGLGYDELSRINDKLIYCSITGYGQTGPYAQIGAFDVTIQAMSGMMSVTGEESGEPVKCGIPVGDFVTGLYAAYCIVASLNKLNQNGGKGTYIDCSMLGSLLGISALQTSEYFGTGIAPKRLGSAHPRNAPYQAYSSSDKPFVIAAGNDKLCREVCKIVDLYELADDPRFNSQVNRAKNQKELKIILEKVFSERSAEYWLNQFEQHGVPCAPINNFEEILADDHVQNMGIVTDMILPNEVVTKTIGFPISMSDYQFLPPVSLYYTRHNPFR